MPTTLLRTASGSARSGSGPLRGSTCCLLHPAAVDQVIDLQVLVLERLEGVFLATLGVEPLQRLHARRRLGVGGDLLGRHQTGLLARGAGRDERPGGQVLTAAA